jgi:hypothetical protein
MTVFLDTSALLKRYVEESGHDLVNNTLRTDSDWCASAITRTETQLCLHRIATGKFDQERLWSAFRDDWDAFASVPVDDRLLISASEIGATFGLRTTDAIQLASAARLPRPITFLTFEFAQMSAAVELGLNVLTTEDE